MIQHASYEGAGILEDILEEENVTIETVHLYKGDNLPRDIKRADLYLVMGGPMGAYEDEKYPFLKREIAFLERLIEADYPVIGFCLGSQLLARAGGGRVFKGHQKEIGWYPISLTEEGKKDRFMGFFPDTLTVFQWHGDTFDLPKGAVHLARGDMYTNQAFKIGKNVYALQFHFEITKEMIESWLVEGDEEIEEIGGREKIREILSQTDKNIAKVNEYARRFFVSFLHELKV